MRTWVMGKLDVDNEMYLDREIDSGFHNTGHFCSRIIF